MVDGVMYYLGGGDGCEVDNGLILNTHMLVSDIKARLDQVYDKG